MKGFGESRVSQMSRTGAKGARFDDQPSSPGGSPKKSDSPGKGSYQVMVYDEN